MATPILPYLYLGPRTAVSPAFVKAHAITDVLSIGAKPAAPNLPGVTYHRLSLSDDTSSSIEQVSQSACGIIDAAKAKGRILVHCSAAVSRSPTVVVAYLMARCDMSLKEALGRVVRARPAVCPNAGFLGQLREMEKNLRGSETLELDVLPGRKDQRLALFVEKIQ